MNPIVFAMRHPVTVMVGVAAVVLASALAVSNLLADLLPARLGEFLPRIGMAADVFPDLNTPVIYVAQPYGGMDPQQMEGFLTNYFEYHFLYITGIDHVESRNIQGLALMKLHFHPGTNMAQAMAETVSYVNRARSFMPPNTVPPFIMRFDAGSVPVGYLVFESKTRSIDEIQDVALFRVRPMFATLPGVSAPPPFGGNQRTIVIRANPERLQAYHLTADDVVTALAQGNQISPSGNVTISGQAPIVPVNSVVTDIRDLEKIPIRVGQRPTVYIRDVARVLDATDLPTGYGLVNGRRSVYILVTKRADASTLSVVHEVKANLPRMQALLPSGVNVLFEFDQSPYVSRALGGLGFEALLGAFLTGLMVLLFLRDWRSVIIVVLNIPFALLGALISLWLTGQTVNLMTLGGLALAVGILVDEATVEVENIHTHLGSGRAVARAVRLGNAQTAVPRLLAMLCILAVFIPSFFMQGAARALFVPLALAVGFSMVASYLLSSTFVPVLSTWLLRHDQMAKNGGRGWFSFARLRDGYAGLLHGFVRLRWLLLTIYLGLAGLLVVWWIAGHPGLGTEIFPVVDSGQFQLRLRAPGGTPLDDTEALAQDVLAEIARQAGGEANVDISVSLVGTASYNYPINSIYLWTAGPQEAVLRLALRRVSGIRLEDFKNRLREELPRLVRQRAPAMNQVEISFEAGDIVADVMSFGSSTPIEVAINGPNMTDNRAYADKVRRQLAAVPSLRDLRYEQSLEVPALLVHIDRELAGLSGVTPAEVSRSLVAATSSSRFITPNYWRDPKSGVGYQVQVEVPAAQMGSVRKVRQIPIRSDASGDLRLEDVAQVRPGTVPGQVDRYNMKRQVSLTANVVGEDLGRAADRVDRAIRAADQPPAGVSVTVRGQVVPMRQMFRGLAAGLGVAVVVILLLLTAYFQSLRLALVVISTAPAVLAGVVLALVLTRTTLNIQSFMGAIMALGVAVANAILLATFAEEYRRAHGHAVEAAVEAARHRFRPILMTSCAMMAGMAPMALGFGEGGQQTAPLARAVLGGLGVATFATLFLLPSVFAIIQGRHGTASASLDPDDPLSAHFDRDGAPRPEPGNGDGAPPTAQAIPVREPS